LSATGAATNSGTRRADRTGVIGDAASIGAAAAGAFSACVINDTPDAAAMSKSDGTTHHCNRRCGCEFSRGLVAGDDGRSPKGARAR